MQYKDDARLDTSQVRSSGGGGGGGIGGGKIAVGGGIGTLLILFLLSNILGVDLTGLAGGQVASGPAQTQSEGTSNEACRTGGDIATDRSCRFVAYTNSIQQYWGETVQGYRPTVTRTFSGQIQTACGTATSAVGPFYCPGDETVYLDTGFFDQLSSQFGAQGGDAAEAYVIAHEYGHHISNLIGDLGRGQSDRSTGPESMAVRLELEADCFAGNWLAWSATDPDDAIEVITADDLNRAVDAAEAVGDDRIQSSMRGQVSPETWTHGSSEMRKAWLMRGYQSGDPNVCRQLMDPNVSTGAAA
ncbi:KPN_02809 family neutral zinc metallopeptidase [Naumannella cuiyingiana]|uniref:Neutral zinc metallopeptidase n=1 Tax=Naumannella cuiyingiana TaxID=1347891 RepID=A0A7Z0DAP4_9ACTN|nr:hypothetical protein [Naumannella cuiyingiana]